jgi:phage terminase large subunit GpA-like protein
MDKATVKKRAREQREIEKIRKRSLQQAVADGLAVLRTEEPLSCNEWAGKHFYLSPESSSIVGRWISRPYQVAILDWFGDDDIEVLTWKKSARTGYTKALVISLGYKIHHKKRKVAIYQPTDTDAKEFSKDEIKPMIRDVPVLRELMKDGDPDKKGSHNKADRKEFLNGMILYVRGAHSPTNFRRITVDDVYHDEVAGMLNDVGGEGSPLVLGDKRNHTSPFGKSIRGSTPTSADSLIEESLSDADMVFERYLCCPECKELFKPDKSIFNLEDPDFIKDDFFVCTECGSTVYYKDYRFMDENGRWMTENGEWYDEKERLFYSHENKRIRPPRHVGLKIWEAYSYDKNWANLFSKWNSAVKKYKDKGSNVELKSFVNTSLGDYWEEIREKVSPDVVKDRLEEYREVISNEILFITMSVDVQGGKDARLEVEICGWGEGHESWSLDYIKIPGEPERIEVWDHIDKLRERTFLREDGIDLPISIVGVDSGYKTDIVYRFTRARQKSRVFSIKGDDGDRPIAGKYTLQGKLKDTKLYLVGVDRAKDRFFTQVRFKQPGPGFCHFPSRYDEAYFKGLFSEEKFPLKRRKKTFTYQKITDKVSNEPLDLRVYNIALVEIANPNFEMIKRRIARKLEAMRHNLTISEAPRRRVRSGGVRA